MLQKLKKLLNKRKVFIDCGANVGEISARYLDLGYTVIAFEPNPSAFEVLLNKFEDNKKITLINKAVWHKNTTLKLYLHENSDEDEVYWSQGSSLLSFKGNVLESKFVEVEVIDLFEFIKNSEYDFIDTIKIDIEGAEVEVLERLIEEKLYTKFGEIFVETHDHKIPELKESTDKIRNRVTNLRIKNIDLDWV